MNLTVYGDSRSGNCLKVKWTADKLNLVYDWVEISVLDGETRKEPFISMNAAGQVPLIRLEDGRTLAQSNAIIAYLAEGSPLIPADVYNHAKMLEWMFWEQYSHEPYIAVARFQMAYLGRSREELEPRLFERGNAALALMEGALEGRRFLVSEALSLADIALAAYTRVAHEGGFDLSAYPSMQAWLRAVEAELGVAA
ncbi:MAG: glutathione S-transferase family protein [Caulobacteraceae bacterium]